MTTATALGVSSPDLGQFVVARAHAPSFLLDSPRESAPDLWTSGRMAMDYFVVWSSSLEAPVAFVFFVQCAVELSFG